MNDNFFNNINGYKLDNQQQNAILNAKTHSLIVAGAGSGKTLTLVGKIKYLIEKKGLKPQEILCISFTNEATKSLKNKINIPNIDVYTFHKLAIAILKQEDIYYEIAPDNYLEENIKKFFLEELWTNKFLKKQWMLLNKKIWLTKECYLRNLKLAKQKDLEKVIANFIALFITNNLTDTNFKNFFKDNKNNALLFIIYAVLNYYERKKVEEHFYDFDDLIKKATEICLTKKVCQYKEIIIDEFQDTSKLRLDFIRAILKHSAASLTVVGDDFQSIYKFSGCNLDIFLNFQKYFPNAKVFKIENTYRNSQELIKVAGNFVMRNKKQVRKDLKSSISLNKPLKIVYYLDGYKALLKTIKTIKTGEILILGRNNFDIYKFIPKNKITWLDNGYFKLENYNFNLRYLTVHKSKGLESNNVIIINLEDSKLGFPCQKKNSNLTYYIQEKEDFLYEEERRLFYVALTRTKNYCYLLAPFRNTSSFVKEIKLEKNYIEKKYIF